MIQSLTKYKFLALGASVGVSLLAANPAEAASFHFSYEWNNGSLLEVRGMVDGDMNGNMLDNPTNIMAEVFQNDVLVATFGDSDFTSRDFTFDGTGVAVGTNIAFRPFLNLQQPGQANFILTGGSVPIAETFSTERWTLEAKPVPEGDMGLVSWLGVAAIGGLSVKYGKRK